MQAGLSDGVSVGGLEVAPSLLTDELPLAALDLARSFRGGATLWCLVPEWPFHAHHVAVEFVHPVIVGKPALPAVMVTGLDPVRSLRSLARAGDILLGIGRSGDPVLRAAMQRSRAWGLSTLFVGAGPPPEAGAADFVLWVGKDESAAPYSGQFVFVYHLLWELTHVALEHPGLLSRDEDCSSPVCVTCSDEGRLAEVVRVRSSSTAEARTPTGIEEVDTTLVGTCRPGDLLLVHAGQALTLVVAEPQ